MARKKNSRKNIHRRDIEHLAAQIADEMAEGLYGRTEEYVARVAEYYTAAVDELLRLAADADIDSASEVFTFSRGKRMSAKSSAILRGLYSAVYQEIRKDCISEWERANSATDRIVRLVMGEGTDSDKRFAHLFSRNREVIEAFFSRKSEYGGLNLSQKVWKYTGQLKDEMELALSISLGRGDSAATVSRKVRQYLQEPERLFRRVRDEEGNLKLSKQAAAYHPGQGMYRSSYKNAMRLTRTETNMAYRAADCDRWADIPFVVGMEVKRSNHPYACAVCEALAGKYPKDFKFVGWHPQCRCYVVPVIASEEECLAYHRAMLNGEDVGDWQFGGQITELPDGAKKWLTDNSERIEQATERGTLPYWLRDNQSLWEGVAAKNVEPALREIVVEEKKYYLPEGLPVDKKATWIENERKVEQALKIECGDTMTFEQANELRANPHYVKGSGDGYTVNCQSTTVCNEMRRRGYDIETFPNTKKAGTLPHELSFDITKAWIDPLTGKNPAVTICDVKYSAEILFDELKKNTQGQGRYFVEWKWKGKKSGHIITAERLKDGTLRFYDPQNGAVVNFEKHILPCVSLHSGIHVLKVDALMPNPKIINGIVTPRGTTKPLTDKAKFSAVREEHMSKVKERAYQSYLRYKGMGLSEARMKLHIKSQFSNFEEVWSYIQEMENGTIKGGADLVSQKELSKQTLEWGRQNVIGKKTYSNPAFGGREARFTKNSFTENLRYGELFEVKSEILTHLDDYLTPDLKFRFENPVHGTSRGFYKAQVPYKGAIEEFRGRNVEFQFSMQANNEIYFYFIKLI